MACKATWLAVCTGLMAAAGSASAAIIPVVNASFETLPAGGLPFGGCGTGCSFSVNDPVPGWNGAGSFGQFQPGPASGNFAYFNFVPNGLTVAYSNGGSLSQTVAAVAVPGVTYTLSVDVGFRKDVPDNGTVALMQGHRSAFSCRPRPHKAIGTTCRSATTAPWFLSHSALRCWEPGWQRWASSAAAPARADRILRLVAEALARSQSRSSP